MLIGGASALLMALLPPLQPWLLPILVLGQTIPVFALAPLLVLWFGYGLASKVVMAILIIYFPVTAALFDGLRRTEPGWLDLARTMGATRWRTLYHLRLPAALPAFGSGLRIATAVAPIGAVVGEWVGSSAGLGYLMLHANARLQIDLMFAALIVLMAIALALYVAVDRLLVRADAVGARDAGPRPAMTCGDPAHAPDHARGPARPRAWPRPAAAAEKLTLLLDWFVNPDHAPIIVADAQGYFAAAGLEVEIVAPADPNDPPKLVAAGQADVAISYQPQLHIQVDQGLPLTRIGTLDRDPAQLPGRARRRPDRGDRRPERPQGRLLGRRLRGRAARGDARPARPGARRRRAGQRQLRPVAGAAVRPGRRGDRRVSQFRAQPARRSRADPGAPSIPRRRASRPTTS